MDISGYINYLKHDLWYMRVSELPPRKASLVRLARISVLTLRGLAEDRWQLRASALTFYSMLSIVPALSMVFGIAKGFGFEKNLEEVLYDRLPGQEAAIDRIMEFSRNLLENVRGGLMAAIGLVILFWTIYSVLSHIESAFNDIWGIKKARPFSRKITDYLAIMIIFPFFMFAVSTMTVFISSQVELLVHRIELLGTLGPLIFMLLQLLPYFVLWLLFSFMYIFMPNTRIQWRSGFLAGIVAGTIYQVFQASYVHFQFALSRYNTIYGSFAALPLFIFWMQISWLIVLFGAEISCSHQTVDSYEFDPDRMNVSHALKRVMALAAVHRIVKDFGDHGRRTTAAVISETLEIPTPLANKVLYELAEAGVISEVIPDSDRPPIYQPAVDPNLLTIKYVMDKLDEWGSGEVRLADRTELKEINRSLAEIGELVAESPANRLLRDI